MNDADLAIQELCNRVATGDVQAAEQFTEELAPLLAVVLRRTARSGDRRSRLSRCVAAGIARQPGAEGAEDDARLSRLARRICGSIVARLRSGSLDRTKETLPARAWRTVCSSEPSCRKAS
jgi:hypothetical protein